MEFITEDCFFICLNLVEISSSYIDFLYEWVRFTEELFYGIICNIFGSVLFSWNLKYFYAELLKMKILKKKNTREWTHLLGYKKRLVFLKKIFHSKNFYHKLSLLFVFSETDSKKNILIRIFLYTKKDCLSKIPNLGKR